MPNNTVVYIFNKLVRLSILFFILYLVFTNFGTFLMIIGLIIAIFALVFYNFKKKVKTNGFEFKFENAQQGFDFNNFNRTGNFSQSSSLGEIQKAKNFFGFTHSPTKEEIKKRYKELAKKYHPDINGGDDTKMKELNNYRDILIKTVE